MSIAKVKTVVIILLLLLNAALGGLVIAREASENAIKKETLESLLCIMEQNGIEFVEPVDPAASAPACLTVARDTASEQAAAAQLLGEYSFTDQGAGIHEYSSAAGWMRFRANGEIDAEFAGIDLAGQEADAYVRGLLKAMSVTVTEETEHHTTGAGFVLTYNSAVEGLSVVNCRLSFIFEGSELRYISGRRVSGTVRSGADETVSLPTALMSWLDHMLEQGAVCKQILGVECGYSVSFTAGAELSLNPVWIVDTDTGRFYVNAVTAEISS